MFGTEGNYQLFSHNKENLIMSLYHEEISETEAESHSHQFTEIFFISEGSAVVEINEKPIKATYGDVLIIDSMVPHRIISTGDSSSLTVISLMFDITAFISEDYIVFHKKELNELFKKLTSSFVKIPCESPVSAKINDVLSEIENEFLDTEDVNIIRSYVILMWSYLIKYCKTVSDKSLIDKTPYSTEIEKTMVYISKNLDKNLTLDEIAHIANMNKTYYSTIFKKVTGKTVWEYILNARVELAISYLVKNDGEFNITEILNMCGFNNAASFNKTFKKFTGKTPTEYKKSKYNSCFSK